MTTQNARYQMAQRNTESLAISNLKKREMRWAGDTKRWVGKLEDGTSMLEGGYALRQMERWTTPAAAVAAFSTSPIESHLSKSMTLTADLTIPSTVAFRILKGGSLNLGGFTLTINGYFSAGPYQVFSNGTVVFGSGAIKEALPEWWGAKPDNSTDCYSAIVAAYTAWPVVRFSSGTYSYGTTIAFTGVGGANDGISFLGAGLFSTVLRYTGSSDGITMGSNVNGVTLRDFRLYSTTGRDAISITAGVASDTPDAGILYFARLDIRGWLRHAIKGRLTVNFNTEALQVVLNGGCGLYIENANPYRATTYVDKGSWFHENGGHGIVLKGTFTHSFFGTISDSNFANVTSVLTRPDGLIGSTDADTISSAGYTLIGGGTWTNCVASDIGKTVTQGGVTVGTLAHYDNTDHHMIINATAVPSGTGALAVLSSTGAGVELYLDASGYTNAVVGDIGKTVLRNGVNVGTLSAYDNTLRKWTITVTTAIAGGGAMTISTGTGAGTASGGSTTSTFRKNVHGFYAARSAYINIQGGHFENHLYGIFLDSVYDSTIAPGYILTQGTGAYGFYAAGTCQRISVPILGVDVQSGGTAAAYKGPLCIGVNWTKPGAYTTVDRSANSFDLDTQNAGSTLVTVNSTGDDPISVSTTSKRVGQFSGTDDVESILSVNNSGGVSGRPTLAWRKDGTILARAFADNNLNSFVFKLGSNVFVSTNNTLEDVVQTNEATKYYFVMQGSSGPAVIEMSNGAAEGQVTLGRWDGVARLNNGEVRAAMVEMTAIGAVANERGGQIILSTRTSGVSGASAARATLDETGLLMTVPVLKSSQTGITASTTQTQGQGALTKDINIVSTCANANDTVTLPSAAAGMEVYIRNNGAQTLKIFPASGDNINGTGTNTAVTLAAGASVTYRTADTTNWYS